MPKQIDTLTHDDVFRTNIPTAEFQEVMRAEDRAPVQVAYARRNRDLDPQLVWRGKDEQDWSELVVPAPPLYIQEKVHPKVLIDDLLRQSQARRAESSGAQPDLFAHFDRIADAAKATEFYRHQEYIHNNPVARGYVDDPLHWRYSSARNYAGMEGLLEVETSW